MSETNAVEELIVMRSKGGDGTIYRQRPLVRCKDCKHGIGDENAFVCGLKQLTAGMDWFCADGVAKDINVPNKEGR